MCIYTYIYILIYIYICIYLNTDLQHYNLNLSAPSGTEERDPEVWSYAWQLALASEAASYREQRRLYIARLLGRIEPREIGTWVDLWRLNDEIPWFYKVDV